MTLHFGGEQSIIGMETRRKAKENGYEGSGTMQKRD